MAHFAKVDKGTVLDIHVVKNEVITDDDGIEQESLGQQFLADLHGGNPSDYVQCSYNANFRGPYPGRGFIYDAELDEFRVPATEE